MKWFNSFLIALCVVGISWTTPIKPTEAATQFYIWAYAYLNGLSFEKGLAAMGGDERWVYIWDKRMQPQVFWKLYEQGTFTD